MLAGRSMTKKAPPVATRHVIRFRWKVVIVFSVALCLLALLRLHSQPDPLSISRSRSRISRDNVFSGPPKIAFLFLVRRNLPLDFLWATFFEVFFFLFLNFLGKIFLSLILIFFFNFLIFFLNFGFRTLTRRTSRYIFIRRRDLCLTSQRRGRITFMADNYGIAFR